MKTYKILFALVLAVCAGANNASAQTFNITSNLELSVQISDFFYELYDDDQTAEVVAYDQENARNVTVYLGEDSEVHGHWDVVIPTSIEYNSVIYTVTGISFGAFNGCGMTSITIPNSITSIGCLAFNNCPFLPSVTIPSSVKSIGDLAFFECIRLKEINVEPDNKYYCSVDGVLFNNDTTILISFPPEKQEDYTLPNSVTSVSMSAFISGRQSNPNPIYNTHVFAYLPELYSGEYEIPEGIQYIADHAFFNCNKLSIVTIPNSVTKIEESAFENCHTLSKIICKAIAPPICQGGFMFGEVDKSIPIYVPKKSVELYRKADGWKEFSNILPIK